MKFPAIVAGLESQLQVAARHAVELDGKRLQGRPTPATPPTGRAILWPMQKVVQARTQVPIELLRPTQMTVGYAEVLLKRQQWRALDKRAQSRFIIDHPLPVVAGPKERHYIIDHHHMGRALLEEKVASLRVNVVGDLSALTKEEFWIVMDYRQWVHPYDAEGCKQPFRDLPKTLPGLTDDPYRSLAAAVRMAGGFPKEQTPFAEFLWADFFRRRVGAALLRMDPDSALSAAMRLVHDKAAMHLPGWSRQPLQR